MYTPICWFLHVLQVRHRPNLVDIGVNTICQRDYRIGSFLSSWHAHGDLCKHLGIYSSTYSDYRYSIGTQIYS